MSKRRRAGAGRRIAEQRFWDGPEPWRSGAWQSGAGGHLRWGWAAASGRPRPGRRQRFEWLGGPVGAAPVERIRPTSDPAAVVRSLGPPPFAIDGSLAERHLTAVYEEAVRAATALAAANGLLAGDEDNEDD